MDEEAHQLVLAAEEGVALAVTRRCSLCRRQAARKSALSTSICGSPLARFGVPGLLLDIVGVHAEVHNTPRTPHWARCRSSSHGPTCAELQRGMSTARDIWFWGLQLLVMMSAMNRVKRGRRKAYVYGSSGGSQSIRLAARKCECCQQGAAKRVKLSKGFNRGVVKPCFAAQSLESSQGTESLSRFTQICDKQESLRGQVNKCCKRAWQSPCFKL